MKLLPIGLLVSALVLQACASKEPKPPKTQELFKTLIKHDGTKQFSYALAMEMPTPKSGSSGGKRGHGGPGGGPGGGGPGGGGPGGGRPDGPPPGGHDKSGMKGRGDEGADEHLNFLFNEGLSIKLGDTGFCQKGFKELDKQSRYGVIQLSGECNDLATEDDKRKFPNPPPKKIKEETIQ